jgi:hypothetical protein
MHCLLSLVVYHDEIPFKCPHLKWSNGGFDVAGCFVVMEGLIWWSPIKEDRRVTQFFHANEFLLPTSNELGGIGVLHLPFYYGLLAT